MPEIQKPAPFHHLNADLAARFPERKDVIAGALAAVLAGEHVLLLGPPGTAKSALARAIAQAFGGTYFERLLTKFSTPEELFGEGTFVGHKGVDLFLDGAGADEFVDEDGFDDDAGHAGTPGRAGARWAVTRRSSRRATG